MTIQVISPRIICFPVKYVLFQKAELALISDPIYI